MRDIKIKRVDDLIIVVSNGTILQRYLPKKKKEKFYKKLKKLVLKINSGLLSSKSKSKFTEKLLEMMTDETVVREEKKKDKTYELAEETLKVSKRKKLMKKVAAIHELFEYDNEGYCYLKNHNIPLPIDLANALLDAKYNKDSQYTVDSLINFWQWACLNPNKEARNDLFGWFKTGEFAITNSGLVVAYRCVAVKKKGISDEFTKFIENAFVQIKSWKKSPKNYGIVKENNNYVKYELRKNPHVVDMPDFKGILSDLYADINSDESGDVYTDNHTKTFTIKIGEEVSMLREDCDEERNNDCSRGLHFMSKKYNLRLGGQKLIVLINPMNIVAFPTYDNTKGRCCAYMPIAKALEDETGDFKELGNGTFDFEYSKYTKDELSKMIDEVGLSTLQEKGYISKELKSSDLDNMKDHFTKILENKLVHVI